MDAVQTSDEQLRRQLVEDIQTLPVDVLQEVSDLIDRLCKETEANEAKINDSEPSDEEDAVYPCELLKKSGVIGCMEGPPDLSVNYKAYLAEGLKEKYGHH